MKNKHLLSLICASLITTGVLGAAAIISPNITPTVIVAHAADTNFDISNFKDGQWFLYWCPADDILPDYINNDFSNQPNSLAEPTQVPATIISNDKDNGTNGQSFTVSRLQLFPNNLAIVGYAPYVSDAVKIEVGEFSPTGTKISNSSLKVEPADAQHPNDNYGIIDGINTIQNNNIAVVKMTPVKANLTGTLYLFFKKAGTGQFKPTYAYSYTFDSSATPTQITDTTGTSTIDAPTGSKTLKLAQTGYIDPQWAGGDSNVKIDSNGKITGLDNPDEAGKSVTFTIKDQAAPTVTHTFIIRIPAKSNPNNGGGSTSVITPTTPSTPTPTNPNWNPSTPNNPDGTGLPNYAAVKGSAVYATKKIYMYKNGDFKKSQRIATYPKQKRINRPMFVVTGYARSNAGALRYKVRDVNHHSKTAGKRGYITANRKYVVRVYYQSMPKNKQITVINPKGVHAYKNKNLTNRVKHFKKGAHLRVKKIIKYHLTSRYQLTNGSYVTANKKLVIQGKY